MVLVVKNPPANSGDIRDEGSIPGSGISPGGGHGNPVWYSCLENPMDRGALQATLQRVTQSRTRLSDFHFQIFRTCCAKLLQSSLALGNPMAHSPPGSPVHVILQARILEWGAISYSRGSS